MAPLRLVLYDKTQAARPPRALGWSWVAGSRLYRALDWADASFGAQSFAEGLDWVVRTACDRPLGELQFWGHGKWGRALIEREPLDISAFSRSHPLYAKLAALRACLAPGALVWFRTCETLGANAGRAFARALGDFTGARVAGHTHVIGYFQSGLHALAPGATPDWDPAEGLAEGTPEAPIRAFPSRPGLPNTITCLTNRIPPRG